MLNKKTVVLNTLLREIHSGELSVGGYIPSRRQLMRRFQCSRTVVERAVAELTAMGFLAGYQGKGTVICASGKPGKAVIRKINVVAAYDAKSFRQSLACLLVNSSEFCVPVEFIPIENAEAEVNTLCQSDTLNVYINPGYNLLPLMNYLKDRNIPQLLVNREFDGFDRIYTEPAASFRQGLHFLQSCSDAPLAVISGEPGIKYPYQSLRMLNFYRVCCEAGITVAPENNFILPFADPEKNIAAVEKILRNRGVKIVVLNSEFSLPLVKFASARGLESGKDYHVLAFEYILALANIPGIAMIRQQYDVFYEELKRYMDIITYKRNRSFVSEVPAELILPPGA